jgi:ABC-type transport system involved in multi-copper enzyme maturation permease subunit
VNVTLLVSLWRQRLASAMRAVILTALVVVWPLFAMMIGGGRLSALGDGVPFALVFAVGMIGQDVSSGVLQLLLARPVKRSEYVLHRWLGVALGASAASLLQILFAWALFAARGEAPDLGAVAVFLAGREIEIFGVAGVMALFSSLIGGVGDLALYMMVNLLGFAVKMVGSLRSSGVLMWIGQELGDLVSPRIELAQIVAGSPSWFAIATFASNLTLCLLLAIWAMNRKELSYASG